jgi:DNA-binding NtrC family response regulator
MDVNARTSTPKRTSRRLDEDPAPSVRQQIAARLVGRGRAVRVLRQRIEGLAPLAIPVLLRGETGSGRATVAALLHALGPTGDGRLVTVDAASFAPERGAPSGSTVHLVGVEQLSRRAQAWWLACLRAPQASGAGSRMRWIASMGDAASIRDAAPDFDPELERLLHRFAIRVPPLRERIADLPLLVADLCARIGRAVGREGIRFSPRAVELLSHGHWPGNVRELEDVIGRAIAFSTGAVISRPLVLDVIAERAESVDAMRAAGALRERERLLEALRAHGGNVTRTAEALGRSRAAVYRLIAAHRIPLAWHRPRSARGASAARGARASARAAGRCRAPRAGRPR